MFSAQIAILYSPVPLLRFIFFTGILLLKETEKMWSFYLYSPEHWKATTKFPGLPPTSSL